MLPKFLRRAGIAAFLALALLALAACGGADAKPTLYIGGIPDQDVAILEARFKLLAEHLAAETGVDVQYLPSQSYSALVTGWKNDDVQLAWYGGLTGVQARLAVPGSNAVAQRTSDEKFTSVFVASPDSGIETLADLPGRTFTFGSESSTSGNLMPRHFLSEAGIVPENDFKSVAYSGSHDATWKQVEAGAVEAGALNANVWQTRLEKGEVDTARVEAFFTTPGYVDYHWVVRPGLDEEFGDGFTDKTVSALLQLNAANGGRDKEIMDAFQADRFIPASNENYHAIESIARGLGLITEQ